MPALESITIKGFKSIRDVTVELRDINVLIGANGSGKSNFIETLSFLQSIREQGIERYVSRVGGADRLLHFGSRVSQEIEVRLRFASVGNEYEIILRPSDIDSLYMYLEAEYPGDAQEYPEAGNRRHGLWRYGDESGIVDPDGQGSVGKRVGRRMRRQFSNWRIYHFHDTSSSAPLNKTANLHDNRHLRPDGSNLAAFLYLLREKHEHSYTFLRNTVRLVAPFFDDFVLEPMALNVDTIRLEWKHVGTDAYFDVSSLSDGTLRFIALATLLQQPVELRPSVILLDEPELGLHPLAITMLASMVKSASVDTQVILATQSPILLDHFEPEDVLVADRVDGATEFKRLSTEELAVWLKDYSIGELWEMNEFDGRPAPERRVSNSRNRL